MGPNSRELVKILVVDDEPNVARACAHFLAQDGWDVDTAGDAEEGLGKLRENERVGIVFLDIRMPRKSGVEMLREIKQFNPYVEVVMITAHGSLETAVDCMKAGACDFIAKPFTRDRILAAAERAYRFRALREEVQRLQVEVVKTYRYENLIAGAPAMKPVLEYVARAAETDSTVLLLGESGTGKDVVARTIHYNSARARKPFLAVNCAALPSELIESELFGHKKGSFTGAAADAVGIFRAADGGTIFLDEVVEMPPSAQAKLLRVLQERRVRPVGATEEVAVDVRVIAATNRDIDAVVERGQFRKDLFYRLSILRFRIPPLRERREDIPLLVSHFVARFRHRFKREMEGVDARAMQALVRHPWEGNVRELENVIERAFALARGKTILVRDLPPEVGRAAHMPEGVVVRTLARAERDEIERALAATEGNILQAARMLGVARPRLYRLMAKHKIRVGEG